jgi:hypothetical protein
MATTAPKVKLYELFSTSSTAERRVSIDNLPIASDAEALLTSAEWDFVSCTADEINQLLMQNATKDQFIRKIRMLNDAAVHLDRIQLKIEFLSKPKLQTLFSKSHQFRIYLEHIVLEDYPTSYSADSQALGSTASGVIGQHTSQTASATSVDSNTLATATSRTASAHLSHPAQLPLSYDNHRLGT